MKKALVTWITWQDGAYLLEFLLKKWYEVHGIKRRTSLFNTDRIDHLLQDQHEIKNKFMFYYGDMNDAVSLIKVMGQVKPDEVYNLAAQSHVRVSFDLPEYTANSDALWTLRLLEAIKINWLEKKTKFYQASTSELYWKVQEIPQTEKTPFYPRSPYACAKLYAYWITVNYREAYGMFACNWILFNHESPIRWETFVTRKITRAVAAISLWIQEKLYLWNIDAKRDWWHARDFVEWMWLMLQQDKPEDFVLATGESHTVREFIELSFKEVWMNIIWKWKWVDEKWYDKVSGKCIIEIDPKYFRPTEVNELLWDASKAKKVLGWKPKTKFEDMVKEMIVSDVEVYKKQIVLEKSGYEIIKQFEDL